jgi:hypothetical protein
MQHVLVGKGRAALWSRRINGRGEGHRLRGGNNGAGAQRKESGPSLL